MQTIDDLVLGQKIKEVFRDSAQYVLNKSVPSLSIDGKFVGDFFDYIMIEPRGDKPPLFYHVYSPYDVISGKTCQYGVVFESGDLKYNAEISPYIVQRSGIMSALVMKSVGINSLADRSLLIIGTGRLATSSLRSLKAYFPELKSVAFINRSSEATAFLTAAHDLGITAQRVSSGNIANYNVIICHSSSTKPILTADLLPGLQKGTFISTFGSEDHLELEPQFYDTSKARVIVDWEQTKTEAVELDEAVKVGLADVGKIEYLKDVFNAEPKELTDLTIYRSHGTPMQNLAVLKILSKV